jgi:hypothetical protein
MPQFQDVLRGGESASNMLPQLVSTNRDRLMRLAASTVPHALQH